MTIQDISKLSMLIWIVAWLYDNDHNKYKMSRLVGVKHVYGKFVIMSSTAPHTFRHIGKNISLYCTCDQPYLLIFVYYSIECVRCHAIKNKIKNYATDKVKKL